MLIAEFTATISPGQVHHWWTSPFKRTHKPQLDAYPVPTFPEGINFTGIKVPIWYGDFGCQCETSDALGNDVYTYYCTVKSNGPEPAMYRFRIWVP